MSFLLVSTSISAVYTQHELRVSDSECTIDKYGETVADFARDRDPAPPPPEKFQVPVKVI